MADEIDNQKIPIGRYFAASSEGQKDRVFTAITAGGKMALPGVALDVTPKMRMVIAGRNLEGYNRAEILGDDGKAHVVYLRPTSHQGPLTFVSLDVPNYGEDKFGFRVRLESSNPSIASVILDKNFNYRDETEEEKKDREEKEAAAAEAQEKAEQAQNENSAEDEVQQARANFENKQTENLRPATSFANDVAGGEAVVGGTSSAAPIHKWQGNAADQNVPAAQTLKRTDFVNPVAETANPPAAVQPVQSVKPGTVPTPGASTTPPATTGKQSPQTAGAPVPEPISIPQSGQPLSPNPAISPNPFPRRGSPPVQQSSATTPTEIPQPIGGQTSRQVSGGGTTRTTTGVQFSQAQTSVSASGSVSSSSQSTVKSSSTTKISTDVSVKQSASVSTEAKVKQSATIEQASKAGISMAQKSEAKTSTTSTPQAATSKVDSGQSKAPDKPAISQPFKNRPTLKLEKEFDDKEKIALSKFQKNARDLDLKLKRPNSSPPAIPVPSRTIRSENQPGSSEFQSGDAIINDIDTALGDQDVVSENNSSEVESKVQDRGEDRKFPAQRLQLGSINSEGGSEEWGGGHLQIILSPDNNVLEVGDNISLSSSQNPQDAQFEWSSSDPGTVQVQGQGPSAMASALSVGGANIHLKMIKAGSGVSFSVFKESDVNINVTEYFDRNQSKNSRTGSGGAAKTKKPNNPELQKIIGLATKAANEPLLWIAGAIWVGALPTFGLSILLGALAGDILWAFKDKLFEMAAARFLPTPELKALSKDVVKQIKLSAAVKANIIAMNLAVVAVIGLTLIVLLATTVTLCNNPVFYGATWLTGYSNVCDAVKNVGSGGGVGTVSGGPLNTNAGSGKCTPVASGPASVVSLQSTCFGQNAQQASSIAGAESGGQTTRLSVTDKCADGNSVSVGLFQINLTNHPINGLNCPNAFTSQFTASNKTCIVKDQALYQSCVTAAQNPDYNIAEACVISKNGASWTQWGANTKCGF